MKFISKRTIDGGMMYYKDIPNSKNLLVIVGRDDYKKDDMLMSDLFELLKEDNYSIIWYEHIGTSTARLLNPFAWNNLDFNKYPLLKRVASLIYKYKALRRICKIFIIMWYPRRWIYMTRDFLIKTEQIPFRVEKLKIFIRSLGNDKKIILLGRSSGGRVSTLAVDEPTVSKVVCLSYPFRHPDKGIEIDRVKHLESIQKPVLIVQGVRDVYGGAHVLQTYRLSSSISVSLIDTDHDFTMSKEDLKKMALNIKDFIERPSIY